MSGFVGCVNLKENLDSKKDDLISMNETLKKRGPDESGYYTNTNILLGYRRLVVQDKEGGRQPMSFKFNGNTYVIVYDGQIYNTDELKKKLDENNIALEGYSDAELLLKAYIFFKEDIVSKACNIYHIFLVILFLIFTLLTILEFQVRAKKIENGKSTWMDWLEVHRLA